MCRGAMLARQCWSGCHAVNQALLRQQGSPRGGGEAATDRVDLYRGWGSVYAAIMSLERLRSAPPCGVEPSFGQLCWSYLSLVVITHDETRAQSAAPSSSSSSSPSESVESPSSESSEEVSPVG